MSHTAWVPTGHFDGETDWIVVGSGAGGASAAVTLARAGEKVLIVEAGAWRAPSDYPTTAFGAMRDLFDDWGDVVAGRALWPVLQARAVGGSTVINSAICVRTPGDVFDLWRARGIDGLEADVGHAQDALERELFAEEAPPEARFANNELAQKGAEKLGLDAHYCKRFVKRCAGSSMCLHGCRAERKQSMDVSFVPEVLRSGGSLWSNAPVTKVVFDGKRAVGVEGRFRHPKDHTAGATFRARARKGVLIAASVTRTPNLLAASGYRHPQLGEGFRAHPGTGVLGVFDEVVDLHQGAAQGWASMHHRDTHGIKLESLSLALELFPSRLSGGGRALMQRLADYRHLAMWVVAVRAESVGQVGWSRWKGRPTVNYTFNAADVARLRFGLAEICRLMFAAGAKSVSPGVYGLPTSIGPDQVHLVAEGPTDPRAYFAVLTHLFGGCGMGPDPKTSVVDADGRVHDAERLWVVDAAAIPTTLGVNPQHTIMALARVWAARAVA